MAADDASADASRGDAVSYASSVPSQYRVVSPYAIRLIMIALGRAGMTRAIITSTIRSPQRQAEAMYDNASANLAKQFAMYGPVGDEVLKVFRDNRSKPRAEVVGLMVQKIETLMKSGRLVSSHVVSPERYKLLNVIDLGVNSNRAANPGTFNLRGFTTAFRELTSAGFVAKFIDETAKSNKCWHIEVKPGVKPLPGA